MNPLAVFTQPTSRLIPAQELEKLNDDYRKVIPSRNTKFYSPDQISLELIERYFQVRPQPRKPKIALPVPAISLVTVSVLIFLIDVTLLGANPWLFVLTLIGFGGGLYWCYAVYAPVRNYLLDLENYLFRESISFEAYENWQELIRDEVRKTSAKSLGVQYEDTKKQVMEGGTMIASKLLIEGYVRYDPIESQSKDQIFLFSRKKSAWPLVDFVRRVLGTQNELRNLNLLGMHERPKFQVADHVQYSYADPMAPGQSPKSHWRVLQFLYFLPLEDVLGVYQTQLDAVNSRALRISGYRTSEYFYQSVLGLQTTVQNDAVEFSLLIGHGLSPSIPTSQTLEELSSIIGPMRTQIKNKKSLALRAETAGGTGSRDIPDMEGEPTAASGETADMPDMEGEPTAASGETADVAES